MTAPIIPIGRAIAAARAAAAAARAARSGLRAGRHADDARGRRGRDRDSRRGGRGRGRGIGEAEDGGADFTDFESTAREAASVGGQAMREMVGSAGQRTLVDRFIPKYEQYAARLAERGGKPHYQTVRNLADEPDAMEDIIQEGFEYLIKGYKEDIRRQGEAATHDEGDDEDDDENP